MRSRTKKIKIFIICLLIPCVAAAAAWLALFEPSVNLFGFIPLDEAKLLNSGRTVAVIGPGEQNDDVFYGDGKIFCPIDSLDDCTLNAFIAIEDKRFYSHHGIDLLRIVSAAKNNILSGKVKEGASTITQQLVKNTHLSGEKTLRRKINEIRIARELDRKYDKKTILENYLNVIYFGNNIFGIGAAAERYFGKAAENLTLPESALLAGIINSPAAYNPFVHPDAAVKRRNLVLRCMLEQNMISGDRYSEAICDVPAFADAGYFDLFASKAVNEAKTKLSLGSAKLFAGNYTICSQRDKTLSDRCAEIVSRHAVKGAFTEILVADNDSGACIANISDAPYDISNIRRQPGSTLKPFVCYAPALEKRLVYTVSPILDEKIDIAGYSPENHDKKYHGWISVSDALAHSYNIPAVKLLRANGVGYAMKTARLFGLEFDKTDNSLALALGAMKNGVTLDKLAESYMTLARGGVHTRLYYDSAVFDADGNCVYSHTGDNQRAIGDDTAFLVTDMLMKCVSDGTAGRLKNCCKAHVAAKTGTVGTPDGNSDAYCVAYCPEYTVAVRISAPNKNAMPNEISGGTRPSTIAAEILTELNPSGKFAPPASVTAIEIDLSELHGKRRIVPARPDCPARNKLSAYFSKRNMPYAFDAWFESGLDDFDKFDIFDAFID